MKTAQLVWTRPIPPRWADAWMERIAFVGPGRTTLVEKPGQKLARLEAYPASKAVAARLTKHFGGRLREVSATAWTKTQAPAKPLKLGKLILFSEAPKPKPSADRPFLVVPAGLAFGTGQHATTAMLLRELAATKGLETVRALDAGTGSGILALALRALGARKVEAFDYDPVCVKTAKANEKLNFKTASISWTEQNFLRWTPKGRYGLICANLFSEVLIQGAPALAKALEPGGTLLLSGVLQIQAPAVARALKKVGLREEQWKRRGKWTMARWSLPVPARRR